MLKPASVGGENSSIAVGGDRSSVARDIYLSNESNDDNVYNPSNSGETDETVGSLKNESDLEGEEDDFEGPPEDDMLAMIHDRFDPFEGPIWEDDCILTRSI